MFIENDCYEWYGKETMSLKGWRAENNNLIYDFGEYEGCMLE